MLARIRQIHILLQGPKMTDDRSAVPGGPEKLDTTATGIDTTVPHSARIWNYWLGGKDNFAVDREAGDAWAATFPGVRDIARASRGFLTRSIRYLADDAGIRQFLDIGTGLPTADNTHQVAQRIAPEARVVYTDNDPMVLTHARALLTGSPAGRTAYLDADLRKPRAILDAKELAETLDLGEPVARGRPARPTRRGPRGRRRPLPRRGSAPRRRPRSPPGPPRPRGAPRPGRRRRGAPRTRPPGRRTPRGAPHAPAPPPALHPRA